MANESNFNVLVIGNNPKKIISKYNAGKQGSPHIVYEFSKAEEYQKKKISAYEEILKLDIIGQSEKEYFQEEVDAWKKMTPEQFYFDLTAGYELDENGNAISSENENGKYKNFHKPTIANAVPFILKNGLTSYSAKKGEIDWEQVHMPKKDTWHYECAWDTVVEKIPPKTQKEESIYNNMLRWEGYLRSFGTKENYVKFCTSFWEYAVVSEKNGWIQLEDNDNQITWVERFYERFIKPLSDDEMLTIYSCVRA